MLIRDARCCAVCTVVSDCKYVNTTTDSFNISSSVLYCVDERHELFNVNRPHFTRAAEANVLNYLAFEGSHRADDSQYNCESSSRLHLEFVRHRNLPAIVAVACVSDSGVHRCTDCVHAASLFEPDDGAGAGWVAVRQSDTRGGTQWVSGVPEDRTHRFFL